MWCGYGSVAYRQGIERDRITTMKRGITTTFSVFFLGCLMSAVPASSQTAFSRDLALGMNGADVNALQIALNRDSATSIAQSGPGSPGQETAHFGPKTAAAVIRFQEKYADQILTPAGLSAGTGYVGARTRAKLAVLTSSDAPSTSIQPASPSPRAAIPPPSDHGVISQQDAFQPVSPTDLLIFGLSHNKVRSGDMLTVTGFGFDPGTMVHIGQDHSAAVAASSSRSFSFQVPALTYGTYDLWVTNSRGSSMDSSPFKLTIAPVSDSRPTMLSVSPTSASSKDTITVTADLLDPSGNTIYSNLGIIKSVPSSDGKKMSFRVDQLPNVAAMVANPSIRTYKVTFGLGTPAGLSLNYGYFTLTK